ADGRLYAYDSAGTTNCSGVPKTCLPLWTATTGGAITSSPAVANGVVYIGSADHTLTAYDAAGTTQCSGVPKTCSPLWTATTGGAVSSSPAILAGVVYVGADDSRLHAFALGPVTPTPTSTALASDSNPSVSGGPVTFTATVTSAAGTPTGTVTFREGTTTLGSGTLTNGRAAFTTNTLTVGTHSITADYGATATFAASTSPPVDQVVNPPAGTLNVDRNNPSCTNSGTGTAAAPFCTISAAALKVTAGKTVSVASGTYPEKVTVTVSGTATAPVTFAAAPGASVTISGGTNGFSISGQHSVVIRGFSVTGTTGEGITVSAANDITIDANHVSDAGQPTSGLTAFGIKATGVTQSRITANITDHNSNAGISLATSSNDNTISGNVSFANARGYVRAAAGIDIRNSTGNQVSRNTVHDNEDSGINAWTGLDDGSNAFVNNVSYANGDHGIDVHNATDARVVANTVYANSDSGIEMTTSTGTVLANNVSVDNGINSPRTSGNIRVDSPSAPTTTVNDDLVFLRTPGVVIDWDGVRYASVAAFRSGTGQESRGIEADPRFVSIASNNYRLTAGSPAIDAADSGAPAQPATDFDGNVRVDDPATVNTGIGPIPYADRGAFEFRP
ncbi:MAG: right-handed parallel beta-helix repeat-containing protein, partial [Acidimicrobiia bacterium]